jgi:hypothetical protein
MKKRSKGKSLKDFSASAISVYGTAKITREQAKEAGLLFYWSGEVCGNGHLTYTYAKGNECRQCALEASDAKRYGESQKEAKTEFEPRWKADKLKYDMEIRKLEKDDYDYDI